ncbi:MAG: c-type cytochrome [Alcaligenaceae bacterium]|nr:c-type cytochrome [Alcaligenaceae bacterium]
MKTVPFVKIAAALSLVSVASFAQAAPTFAQVDPILKANACLACHQLEKKVVGPAYKDVAEKYKGGDQAVADMLASRIKKGASGVWGPVPMPPNPRISDADLKLVVEWLMAGAPK